jgi:hypothetical protein
MKIVIAETSYLGIHIATGVWITINRKTISTSIAAILIIALAIPWVCFTVQAQTDTAFEPTDQFSIPEYNSTINFNVSGTYRQASLENGRWNFTDLHLNNSAITEKLSVSAQNSNVTITSYQTSNATLTSTRLRYTVLGSGTQTFNLELNRVGGEWSVTVDGVFITESEGWSLSPDKTITITGAASSSNVSIYYFIFDDALGVNGGDANQSFLQQHLVLIMTAIVVAVTVVIVVVIKRRNHTKPEQTPLGNPIPTPWQILNSIWHSTFASHPVFQLLFESKLNLLKRR